MWRQFIACKVLLNIKKWTLEVNSFLMFSCEFADNCRIKKEKNVGLRKHFFSVPNTYVSVSVYELILTINIYVSTRYSWLKKTIIT